MGSLEALKSSLAFIMELRMTRPAAMARVAAGGAGGATTGGFCTWIFLCAWRAGRRKQAHYDMRELHMTS